VLFDEIDKAAPSMTRLLMGVLDKGLLRLGDNTTVNFRKEPGVPHQQPGRAGDVARKSTPSSASSPSRPPSAEPHRQAPEHRPGVGAQALLAGNLSNRIDCIITYQPLTAESLSAILDHQHCRSANTTSTRGSATGFIHPRGAIRGAPVPAAEGHQSRSTAPVS